MKIFSLLLKKRYCVITVFTVLMTGCTSISNKFDKSPCACKFAPLNTENYGSRPNA